MKAATKSYKSFNTLKQYWTLDSTDYWHLQYPLNNTWEEYYWDMSEKAFQCNLPRDQKGITQYKGEDGNIYYSSIELAQYAMASYQAYLKTKDKKWLKESINHIDFFISLASSYKSCSFTVLNNYPIALYKIDHPWPTGLGFGVAISLMVRLYEELNESKYLDYALKLSENFRVSVEDGGILRKVNYNNKELVILEEYPTSELSGVMNGHIFALWGLYDLGRYDNETNEYYKVIVENFGQNLKVWIGRQWTFYDATHIIGRKKNYASAHYHLLHVRMLLIMYKISGLAIFADAGEKSIRQKYSWSSRLKAFVLKMIFRLK